MYIYRGSSSPVGKFVRFVQFLRPVGSFSRYALWKQPLGDERIRLPEQERQAASEQNSSAVGLISPDSVTSVTSFSKFPYNKYIHLEPNVFLYRKFRILITLTTQI